MMRLHEFHDCEAVRQSRIRIDAVEEAFRHRVSELEDRLKNPTIKDAEGKDWECNVPHPMPFPVIASIGFLFVFAIQNPQVAKLPLWSPFLQRGEEPSHWMAIKLPQVPEVPKTQDEIDAEQCEVWIRRNSPASVSEIWHAALAWERSRKP